MKRRKFTHDVIVIGGGAAGQAAATGCAKFGLKTALVEAEHMGGDGLYYGCVPSRTLLYSASILHNARELSQKYNFPSINDKAPSISGLKNKVQSVIETLKERNDPSWFRKQGIEVYLENARFTDEDRIYLDSGSILTAPNFVFAAGSLPDIPPIDGLRQSQYLTSRNIFTLSSVPAHMIILGGGPVGTETAQIMNFLGSKITIIEKEPHVLPGEDGDMADILEKKMRADGINVLTCTKVTQIEEESGKKNVMCTEGNETHTISGDAVFVALGRKGRAEDASIKSAGIEAENGFLPTDNTLRTEKSHIYACGDANGMGFTTHIAEAEGAFAAWQITFNKKAKFQYKYIPRCIYTDPEIASVGMNEKMAAENGINFKIHTASFASNPRAVTEDASEGQLKLILNKKDIIIGAEITARRAGELIMPAVYAVREGWKIDTFFHPIYPYPTLSGIYKTAAEDYLSPVFSSGGGKRPRRLFRRLFRF